MKPWLIMALGVLSLTPAAAMAADPVIDANGDGKVSLPEYQAFSYQRSMQRADTNRDGKISKDEAKKAGGAPGPMVDMFWGRVDTNRDGFLTRPELDVMATDGFKRVDKDHDGFLSQAEIAAARRR
ncbi:MAG: hypothetical protein U1E50_18360 [Caulobacteraceae bacterium]